MYACTVTCIIYVTKDHSILIEELNILFEKSAGFP